MTPNDREINLCQHPSCNICPPRPIIYNKWQCKNCHTVHPQGIFCNCKNIREVKPIYKNLIKLTGNNPEVRVMVTIFSRRYQAPIFTGMRYNTINGEVYSAIRNSGIKFTQEDDLVLLPIEIEFEKIYLNCRIVKQDIPLILGMQALLHFGFTMGIMNEFINESSPITYNYEEKLLDGSELRVVDTNNRDHINPSWCCQEINGYQSRISRIPRWMGNKKTSTNL